MTGRKYMRGPRGTGFLYARRATTAQIEPLLLDNHAAKWTDDNAYTVRDDARRFENWERYFAGVIGLKVAADQTNELGMEPIWARLRELADGLRARLSTLKGVTLTDLGKVKGAIVTFAVDGADHNDLKPALRAAGDQRHRLDPVLLAARSQGPRPAERHAGLGACLQHRGGARSFRGGATSDHMTAIWSSPEQIFKLCRRQLPSPDDTGAAMAIDFHSKTNCSTYTGRQADGGWAEAIRRIVDPRGKRVADIGCGGGIYSRAWREIGAGDVVGIDFSAEMVAAAREQAWLDRISFRQGDAMATGMPSASVDIVFQRALIHHLKATILFCRSTIACSAPSAGLIVQDRTPTEVRLPRRGRSISEAISSSAFRDCWRSKPRAGRRMRPSAAPCRHRALARSRATRCGKSAEPMAARKGRRRICRHAPGGRSSTISMTRSSQR